MSFFPSLMGDFDDDPFMGHMRQMNSMMSSFFGGGSPFGSGGMLGMGGGAPGGEMMPFGGGPMMRGAGAPLMPFGFPDMSQLFQNGGGNCHSFSSSTITTMSNGPDGTPQVYQASQSVRSGPGGVKETKKAVADSRTGVKKLAIGHHIGERAHIVEREHNMRSGEHVENQEYINLEEEEAPEFHQEWRQKTARYSAGGNAIGYHQPGGGRRSAGGGGGYHTPAIMPAQPQTSSAAARSRSRQNRKSNSSSALPLSARTYRSAPKYDSSLNYPALPSSSRGRHAEREAEHEEEEEEEEDEEECGVKIVEVDDDYEEQGEKEDDANNEENAESVVYVTEEDTVSKGGKNEEGKGGQRSRGKKRSHEPEVAEPGANKSQKIQNRP